MTERQSGTLPLVIVAATLAAGMGLFAWRQGERAGALDSLTGQLAPPLLLPDVEGKLHSLAELRGKVVFLNFWATWCAPCREEAPSLERLYRELEPQGFAVLAVNVDDAEGVSQVESFRREFSLSFAILRDPDKQAYGVWGLTGVPETFLIDRDGRVIEHFVGPRDWSQPRYTRVIRELLSG